MDGSSISNPYIDVDDDLYFPPSVSQDPISDEKYTQQLQLHEALVFSSSSRASSSKTPIMILDSHASRASTSSSIKTPIVILDDQASRASTSSSPKTPSFMCIGFIQPQDANRDTREQSFTGHVATKIQENITEVRCPNPNCRGIIGPEACRLFVSREVLERSEDALCESLIFWAAKFYCPFKDCSALLVNDGGGASLRKGQRDPSDLMLRELAKNKNWKRCPGCTFYVEKISGCDNIICRRGHTFDYRSDLHDPELNLDLFDRFYLSEEDEAYHDHDLHGTLSRYKARLVANGSTQVADIDVDETYSPEFSMTDLGSLDYFLGNSVRLDCSGMFLSQRNDLPLLSRTFLIQYNRFVSIWMILGSLISRLLNGSCGQVRVLHVPYRYQYAYIFIKGLPSALFEEFCMSPPNQA
nr:hypothetical protein [Tanacetum cinerariifolium]